MLTKTRTSRRALLVLLTMVFLYQADATIVNVASPSIRADLGASGAALELVISGYLMTSAALIVIGARLGHQYGHGRVFLVGVAVFGLASLACGLAPNAGLLIAARVLQGIGGALAFPQVLTGVQLDYPAGPERTRALGWYSAALAGGAVSGQILGGLLVSADLFGLAWRPIFLINVPITLGTLAVGARSLGRGAIGPSSRLDVPGAAAMFLAVLALVLPLTLGRQQGWPAWTWGSVALSVVLFAVFLLVERHQAAAGRAPLVDLALVRRPVIAWALAPQAITTATYWGMLLTLALYLQDGLGRSALASGLTLLPWVIAFAVPGTLLPRAPERWAPVLPVVGCAVLLVAYLGLAVTAAAGVTDELVLVLLLAVGGFGLGTVFNTMLVRLTSVTPAGRAADISGTSSTTMQLLGAVGVAAFGSLYLAQSSGGGHAFAVVTTAYALTTGAAGLIAWRSGRLVGGAA